MGGVGRKQMIVHPGWVEISNHQEHDHGPQSTTAAPRPPDHAAAVSPAVSCGHLAGLPVCADRPADRAYDAGLCARLAAVRQRELAALLRLLPPRPLVAYGLPASYYGVGPALALSRWPASPVVVGGRYDDQRQALRP